MEHEDPGEEAADTLIEYLEDQPEAYDIRKHNAVVDFTIGDPDLWPSYSKDNEIRAIRSSSVSFSSLLASERGIVSATTAMSAQTGQNVHLPPAREELFDELMDEWDFPDKFVLVDGTFELGGLLPSPEGVCTPHLIVKEDAELDEVIEALDEAFRLYDEVYNGGEEVIKTKPDD